MQYSIPLAIIEDQAPIREALNEYLGGQPEFACVPVAASMEKFLKQVPRPSTPPAPRRPPRPSSSSTSPSRRPCTTW